MAEAMIWSMYYDTELDYDEWVEDYRTEVPDGVYDVYFPYIKDIGHSTGVMVKDGQFVPEPTIAAITDARDMVAYWGVYIEDMVWDENTKAFNVSIGS